MKLQIDEDTGDTYFMPETIEDYIIEIYNLANSSNDYDDKDHLKDLLDSIVYTSMTALDIISKEDKYNGRT